MYRIFGSQANARVAESPDPMSPAHVAFSNNVEMHKKSVNASFWNLAQKLRTFYMYVKGNLAVLLADDT
jgi:hypothetical protein